MKLLCRADIAIRKDAFVTCTNRGAKSGRLKPSLGLWPCCRMIASFTPAHALAEEEFVAKL
jgi:hypothetical protein